MKKEYVCEEKKEVMKNIYVFRKGEGSNED